MNQQAFRAEAMLTRDRLIKRLRASTKITTSALASTLADCTATAPCRSGACPLCGLQFQGAAVDLIEHTIGKPAQAYRGRMSMVTIVPTLGIADPDELTAAISERLIADVKEALHSVEIAPGIFCVDVSFNDDMTNEIPPHWSVHAHGIILDWLSEAQKAELKGWFPSSDKVKRPVMVVPLNERPDALAYVCKWQRERRESYIDDSGRDERRPHRATRSKLLRPAQAVNLALVEHRLGLTGRLFAHKVDEGAIDRVLSGFKPSNEP